MKVAYGHKIASQYIITNTTVSLFSVFTIYCWHDIINLQCTYHILDSD